jgi:type III pantothenate kinase
MMNLIAVDIGNTNIAVGLFLKGEEKYIKAVSGGNDEELSSLLKSTWEEIPAARSSKEKKHDGVIVVSSVKPAWTEKVQQIVLAVLGEKILLVGKNIPYPIDLSVRESNKIGSDRVLAAAAAYAVVEAAVVVADFGTAVTIDLVDDRGVFVGGVICPGFEISAKALNENTALLPKVSVSRPELPWGRDTVEAINCGLYYSAIGTLEEVIRRFAEKIGVWPQTVITGTGAIIIREDCPFIDSYVPNMVVKGIALAYRKYLDSKME